MLLTEDYKKIIHHLFQKKPEKKRRTDCFLMQTLLHHYDNPHQGFPMIHVTGTNGKGQVAAKIAFALQNAGYKVGLFISPHLFDYTERITINGQKIPKKKVIKYHLELENLLAKYNLNPNFFECTTTYAFRYFQEEKIDVGVIESGLGGKFDATNVIEPILSIITSVSYDHKDYLGTTLKEVAEQKAGIIKSNVPVVVGPNAKLSPIFRKAKKLACPIHVIEKKSCFYDTENRLIANKALILLKKQFILEEKNIEKGLKFSLPCRFEKKGNILYDVAHNPDGFKKLSNALEYHYPYRTFRFVIGISKEKDLKACLSEIEKKAHFIHFVQAKKENAATPQKLAEIFQCISSCPFSTEKSVSEGFQQAKIATDKKDILVVCGSFYIMSEIGSRFRLEEYG